MSAREFGPQRRLLGHHQLDHRPALGGRSLLPRRVEHHPHLGGLRLGELECDRGLPPPLPIIKIRIPRRQPLVEGLDPGADLPSPGQLGRSGDLQLGLVHIVEEGEEPVILALADRVVLVIVALGAADRQAEEDRAGRVDPVNDRLDPELLDIDPPLLVDLRVPVEPGRDPLCERGAGPEIAGNLVDREPVVRQVRVERGDDPVAVFPDRAGGVDVEAVGIGITRLVEPGRAQRSPK